jgi:hypothetical protein
MKVVVSGKRGVVNVVPPAPRDDGGFVLTLNGVHRYCAGFGGAAGVARPNDGTRWLVRNPTAEACPEPVP